MALCALGVLLTSALPSSLGKATYVLHSQPKHCWPCRLWLVLLAALQKQKILHSPDRARAGLHTKPFVMHMPSTGSTAEVQRAGCHFVLVSSLTMYASSPPR